MKKIILSFNEDMTVDIEAEGFSGKSCQAATLPYEQELGGVTHRKLKPEALQQSQPQDQGR